MSSLKAIPISNFLSEAAYSLTTSSRLVWGTRARGTHKTKVDKQLLQLTTMTARREMKRKKWLEQMQSECSRWAVQNKCKTMTDNSTRII